MKWNPDYYTYNDFIDTQHKELVCIVNELENSFTRDDANIPQSISSVLKCVRYCIELKQNFLKDSLCDGLEKQSHFYYESFNQLFDFFVTAQVNERVKISFIVKWIEKHLISEKLHFVELKKTNTLPEKYTKINYSDNRIVLNEKYEKLKSLIAKRLIDDDDLKKNKATLFVNYVFNLGLNNFSVVYNELDELCEAKIISDTEKAEYLASFLKKAGASDALSKINDIDGKLRYLTALNQNKLLSNEKFKDLKKQVLTTYLVTNDEHKSNRNTENIIINSKDKSIASKETSY